MHEKGNGREGFKEDVCERTEEGEKEGEKEKEGERAKEGMEGNACTCGSCTMKGSPKIREPCRPNLNQ